MGHKGVVSGYTIFTSIPRLMDDQRDPWDLGRHNLFVRKNKGKIKIFNTTFIHNMISIYKDIFKIKQISYRFPIIKCFTNMDSSSIW